MAGSARGGNSVSIFGHAKRWFSLGLGRKLLQCFSSGSSSNGQHGHRRQRNAPQACLLLLRRPALLAKT